MNLPALVRTSLLLVLCIRSVAALADPSPQEWATARLKELTQGDTCGVAVLVARDGKILFQGGAGFAELESKTPVTAETKFRIGSVTKQFVAAAILRLAEEKKLALTDTLAKFYPDFPGASGITLHHLLTHTSGLHSYTDKPDFAAHVREPIEPTKLIASFQNDPPDFAPGAKFHYNNSAYFLAGEIVAKISGKSLADYLRETFFHPLEMNDTGIYLNAGPPAGVAKGYSYVDGKLVPARDWEMSWAGGAGALYSTVGDLFRWNEALFGGRVLNEASRKLQITPNKLPEGAEGLNYGYGLIISDVRRLPSIGHGGGLDGWSSALTRLPAQNCTIAVLINAMPPPPGFDVTNITRALAEHFLADDIAKIPAVAEDKTVDPKTFAAFAGRYEYQGTIVTFTVDNGHLFAQMTGQPKLEIFPSAPNEFFWRVVDAKVVFLRDEKGEVVAAQHTQNGGTLRAPKLRENEGAKLTADELDAFVGQYQYGPGAVLTVSCDGLQLHAQLTGQPQYPIFAVSPTSFEWHVVPASVQFVKDPTGKVTKAVHMQGRTTFDAPKIK